MKQVLPVMSGGEYLCCGKSVSTLIVESASNTTSFNVADKETFHFLSGKYPNVSVWCGQY